MLIVRKYVLRALDVFGNEAIYDILVFHNKLNLSAFQVFLRFFLFLKVKKSHNVSNFQPSQDREKLGKQNL